MARDYYLESDGEPSSSQVPAEPECIVRYKEPPPPTQIRTIMEKVRQREKQSAAAGPSSLDTLSAATAPRPRRPHDRSHPAYARATERVPAEVPPHVKDAKRALASLMTHTAHTILANADRKAAKLLQGASAPTAHKSLQGGVSKHARKRAAPVRREHTSEDVFPIPDIPPAQSRLKSWATDPAISVNAGVPMDQDERPLAGPSRPTPKPPFFKSRINEPDYDFPSSTPTPPAKPRTAQYWDGASSSSSTSLSRSSSSPFPPPWLHHDRSSRRNSVNLPVLGQDHEVSESSILQDSYDVYMMNNEPTVEPEPQEPEPEVRPVPYISPSALPTSSMLPPPVPALVRVPRPDPPPSTGFAAPSLTPIPPSLSRPFVPPSQVPSGSQLERPRASQRPKVLGMRPMYPQSSKFQSKPKPFKVPFAKKPSGSSGSGSGSTSGSGAGQAGGRSMSPVIPDPPYVAARVAALDEPGLEMTARRPEPARMDEDEDEGPKDANSSADMWAALDAIE